MKIVITPNGNIRCLYAEIVDLSVLGPLTISRASHVEPTVDGRWTADMAPSHGPVLGPFHTRSQALAAEIDWLLRNRLMAEESTPPD